MTSFEIESADEGCGTSPRFLIILQLALRYIVYGNCAFNNFIIKTITMYSLLII